MPLHITKVAFGASSLEHLADRLKARAEAGPVFLTTRYLPKRHEEMVGGSLYWIFEHAIVARSEILGFEQREDGRWTIRLAPKLIPVEPRAKRAHQGWRYLEDANAPRDLSGAELEGDILPGRLVKDLAKLGLV